MSSEIRDSIVIEAPRRAVFTALTDAQELGNWMATQAESDPRPGGSFSLVFRFDDPDQNNTQSGRYGVVDADSRVSIPWMFPFSGTPTTVEYELTEQGAATHLAFRHSGFETGEPWDTARERFGPGWKAFLGSLKVWVEQRTPNRPLGIRGPEEPMSV